jgi:hypothetical protein
MAKLAQISIWICLIANTAALVLALIRHQFGIVSGASDSLLFFYLFFAGLVAPVLFIVSLVGAPQGAFRFGWPTDDAPVRRFRWLFWGNLAVVTVFFTLFFGGFLR